MLSRKRTPRTADERMILGNFRMMQFAWEKRNQPLDCDLIRELHHCGVQEIDDAKYKPGQFRTSDEVVVVDQDGQTCTSHRHTKSLNSACSSCAHG